jgi:gliding motility-associated-like protein
MKRKYNYFLLSWLIFFGFSSVKAQNVSLFEQFNGRYDFTCIGNTLNPAENTLQLSPDILTESSAELNLSPDVTLLRAYLYWAGSGDGDFEVELNGQTISAQRNFGLTRTFNGVDFTYFSAFSDITSFIETNGNGTYTLTGLDNVSYLPLHFQRRTNFAGWAIILVFYHQDLPLNQINIYDGLQSVPQEISITLSSLNVIDNQDAKIGFLAWEGDMNIAVNETLRINGTVLSNPPLNPANNAFNGTNSVTGNTQLFNMDLDIYDIQNNIEPGDQSAEISLTSGQDFVMINAVITKLNSQVPDAVIAITETNLPCDSRLLSIDFTVTNLETATNPLPTNTPIAIYVNNVLIAQAQTQNSLGIGESETFSLTVELPIEITDEFELKLVVDDNGLGESTVNEINEVNNSDITTIRFIFSNQLPDLLPIISCNKGFQVGQFDLIALTAQPFFNAFESYSFHETEEDAQNGLNPIFITSVYEVTTPTTLYIRLDESPCPAFTKVELLTENCPPTVYNFISANEDGWNDYFFVKGLRNIFLDFKIEIFNRWGKLIWTGSQQTEDWRGETTEPIEWNGTISADGTYYYVIHLNDPNYRTPLQGYLYITR